MLYLHFFRESARPTSELKSCTLLVSSHPDAAGPTTLPKRKSIHRVWISSTPEPVGRLFTGWRMKCTVCIFKRWWHFSFCAPVFSDVLEILRLCFVTEVRISAVEALCSLAQSSPSFAEKCLDFLVDMFNDEIEEVRLQSIHALRQISTHITLREDQLDTVLAVLEVWQTVHHKLII